MRGGGFGRRIRGRAYGGTGFRRWVPHYEGYPAAYPAPPSAEDEMKYLQDELEYLKGEVKATEDRISELRKAPEE